MTSQFDLNPKSARTVRILQSSLGTSQSTQTSWLSLRQAVRWRGGNAARQARGRNPGVCGTLSL